MKHEKNRIIIGTSGFSYPDWKDAFYPADLLKEKWLEFYSEHFGFCELNFSYYRMPSMKQMEKFLEYPLKFAVKAHRSMTHDRLAVKTARHDFLEAVRLLLQDDHLAAVLLQFPYSFGYTAENRMYLLELLEDISELPLVVEFRHPAWVRESVFQALRKGAWGVSVVDSPQIPGGMPIFEAVTSDVGYLRFHGRNGSNWWTGDNVSRYDYEYSPDELNEWLPRIADMARQAKTTYVSFNNHARGQAIKNANQLKSILTNANLL